jgi:hypothetical protein
VVSMACKITSYLGFVKFVSKACGRDAPGPVLVSSGVLVTVGDGQDRARMARKDNGLHQPGIRPPEVFLGNLRLAVITRGSGACHDDSLGLPGVTVSWWFCR